MDGRPSSNAVYARCALILVDTSVWIDFFAGSQTIQNAALSKAIDQGEDICTCGLVLTEVLQGIKSDKEYEKVKGLLLSLIYLPITKSMFINSAQMYRAIRRTGKTIRSPVDCMIASICIEHEVRLLHNDKDFEVIAHHSFLKIERAR
jgi:predicted nucleic acid-binding protein